MSAGDSHLMVSEPEDDEFEDEGSEFVYNGSLYSEVEQEEVLVVAPRDGVLSLSSKPERSIAMLDEYEMEENGFINHSTHRSGYVTVVGKPNVGKSTLSNQMIGQKLSIVTDKPQTTRHRILGICSGPEYQMILYDTPGVIEKKMHKLDSMMMKNVRSAVVNADCVVVVVDARKMPEKLLMMSRRFLIRELLYPRIGSILFEEGANDTNNWGSEEFVNYFWNKCGKFKTCVFDPGGFHRSKNRVDELIQFSAKTNVYYIHCI